MLQGKKRGKIITLLYPKLSHPWHANQQGRFTFNVHVLFVLESVVPRLTVYIRQELLF